MLCYKEKSPIFSTKCVEKQLQNNTDLSFMLAM